MKPLKSDIELWCTALRSGTFKQTHGILEDEDGLCCLGVACVLFISPNKWKLTSDDKYLYGAQPAHQPAAPQWLHEVNMLNPTGEWVSDLNDVHRLTFDEIADVLEAVYIHEVLGS
jgi:hypothetical protein